MKKFKVSPKLNIKRVTASSNIPETLKGSIINERLETLCYWSPNAIFDAYIDDDKDYTFEDAEDCIIDSCSHEMDTKDAVSWGRECTKAVFENREPEE